jgi:peptide/nickel transport system substrate-binding protein
VIAAPGSLPTRREILRGAVALAGLAAVGCSRPQAHREGDDRLVVGMNQMPATLDFSLAGGGTNSVRPLIENIIEGLVSRTHAGDIVPSLADWTASDDARTIRFKLRQGVKFHNGAPFTSEDVLFSHQRLSEHAPLYRGRTRSLKHVEIIDEHTVDFHFATSGLSFVRSFVIQIFSKRYHDEVGEERFVAEPVGTGPYRLAHYRRFEYADLDAFEDYWGGKPPVSRVRVVFVQEDMTRIAMLRSGEADIVMATPFSMVPMLRQAGYESVQADVHPTFSVRFQLANSNTPWADRRVRLAIAHAIDAPAIISGVFGALPKHYAGFAPGELGYDPDLKPYPYDVARARALLAEAGYADGFRMPLTYWENSYYGIRETTEAVVLYLKSVGIQCDVAGIDTTQGLAMNRSLAKDPHARAVTIAPALLASYADPIEAMRQGYSSASPYSWYHDPQFDALFTEALKSTDVHVQDVALRKCAHKLHDDLPIIPLWNNVIVYTMRPGVSYVPTARDIPSMLLKDLRVQATTT